MKKPRNTIAKRKILELINESASAVSSQDIHAGVGTVCDRATVYRVLGRLVDEGEVHKIIDLDGVVRYAACEQCDDHHHHHDHIHFSCEKCNALTCLEEVVPEFTLPKNYKANSVNFTVSGICEKCA
ncbi:MAG: Fur family transcriptional regulator [Cryomorphaceae bacterium]|nr:MAG: Fur family transcriptional regulator [Cryomorphaceae bacterium]